MSDDEIQQYFPTIGADVWEKGDNRFIEVNKKGTLELTLPHGDRQTM